MVLTALALSSCIGLSPCHSVWGFSRHRRDPTVVQCPGPHLWWPPSDFYSTEGRKRSSRCPELSREPSANSPQSPFTRKHTQLYLVILDGSKVPHI
ncbi:hypothetical protein FIBSPDRAFT_75010 [Athelia psychrophila]|uniref:Secreted protein n=1 Tax=Athelia psychrophila TaxID=1759441 RepID=A0A166EJM5_9AGAM|nr:hypothetical protein FIBSPDRAFT_75010 [Fibularhizoctonia sp. CBS 109695]